MQTRDKKTRKKRKERKRKKKKKREKILFQGQDKVNAFGCAFVL